MESFRRLLYRCFAYALLIGAQYSRTCSIEASTASRRAGEGRSLLASSIEPPSNSCKFLDGIPTLQRLNTQGRLPENFGEPVTTWGSSTRIHKVLSVLLRVLTMCAWLSHLQFLSRPVCAVFGACRLSKKPERARTCILSVLEVVYQHVMAWRAKMIAGCMLYYSGSKAGWDQRYI